MLGRKIFDRVQEAKSISQNLREEYQPYTNRLRQEIVASYVKLYPEKFRDELDNKE